MSRHRTKRRDTNHGDIVRVLEQVGFAVKDTSQLGGFVDVVASRANVNYLIEIKDGSKPPSDQVLTPKEQEFHDSWRGPIEILRSTEEALAFSQRCASQPR